MYAYVAVKPKRFCVFCYKTYYPGGGWCDFEASYDTLEEAKAHPNGFTQIVDLETGEIEGEKPYVP